MGVDIAQLGHLLVEQLKFFVLKQDRLDLLQEVFFAYFKGGQKLLILRKERFEGLIYALLGFDVLRGLKSRLLFSTHLIYLVDK
jgi:hypothetical protein